MFNKNNYTTKDGAMMFLFSVIAVFCFSIFMSNLIGVISGLTQVDINIVASYKWVNYLNMFLSAVVFLLVFVIYNFVKKKDFVVATKLKVKFDLKIFIGVVVLSALLMFACINPTGLFNHIFSLINSQTVSNTLAFTIDNFGSFILVVFLLAVLPAVCEELVFRGVIYNGLRQKFSTLFSVLISAGLFTLIHFSIYKTFYQFILGVVLALLVHYTGSIVYSMIYHFVNNFIIILFSYISPTKSLFEFTFWGAKEIILTIVFLIVAALIAYLFFKILKNYTYKHKNYFNIQTTNKPLGEVETNDEKLEKENIDTKNLSEYDKKLLLSQNKGVSDTGWLFIAALVAIIIWSFNSFGGFL